MLQLLSIFSVKNKQNFLLSQFLFWPCPPLSLSRTSYNFHNWLIGYTYFPLQRWENWDNAVIDLFKVVLSVGNSSQAQFGQISVLTCPSWIFIVDKLLFSFPFQLLQCQITQWKTNGLMAGVKRNTILWAVFCGEQLWGSLFLRFGNYLPDPFTQLQGCCLWNTLAFEYQCIPWVQLAVTHSLLGGWDWSPSWQSVTKGHGSPCILNLILEKVLAMSLSARVHSHSGCQLLDWQICKSFTMYFLPPELQAFGGNVSAECPRNVSEGWFSILLDFIFDETLYNVLRKNLFWLRIYIHLKIISTSSTFIVEASVALSLYFFSTSQVSSITLFFFNSLAF